MKVHLGPSAIAYDFAPLRNDRAYGRLVALVTNDHAEQIAISAFARIWKVRPALEVGELSWLEHLGEHVGPVCESRSFNSFSAGGST